jgi:hypothetical protein
MAKSRRRRGSAWGRRFDRLVDRHPAVLGGILIAIGAGLLYGAWHNYGVYRRYALGPPAVARTVHLTVERVRDHDVPKSRAGALFSSEAYYHLLEIRGKESPATFQVSQIAMSPDQVRHALAVLKPGDRVSIDLAQDGLRELAQAGDGDLVTDVLGLRSEHEVLLDPVRVAENQGSNASGLTWVLGLLGLAGVGMGLLIAIPTPAAAKGGAAGSGGPAAPSQPEHERGAAFQRELQRVVARSVSGRKFLGKSLAWWVTVLLVGGAVLAVVALQLARGG